MIQQSIRMYSKVPLLFKGYMYPHKVTAAFKNRQTWKQLLCLLINEQESQVWYTYHILSSHKENKTCHLPQHR